MGSDDHYPEEAPAHRVAVDGFWIDRFAGDQRRSSRRSSRRPATSPSPSARSTRPTSRVRRPENLVPGSLVFTPTAGPGRPASPQPVVDLDARRLLAAPRRARAARSTGREDHPVVHVAYEDAEAYAAWAGKSLPTEAEWECAARGGLDGATYVWGDEPEPPGERLANYWHGDFPWRRERGLRRARRRSARYPPNGYGLHDMAGNVWEWTDDWYASASRTTPRRPCCVPREPARRHVEESYDPAQPQFRDPAQGDQGRLLPLRRQLLPALPARRPPPADDRHRHEPHRLPLRGSSSSRGLLEPALSPATSRCSRPAASRRRPARPRRARRRGRRAGSGPSRPSRPCCRRSRRGRRGCGRGRTRTPLASARTRARARRVWLSSYR